MTNILRYFTTVLILAIVIVSCAKRGTPTGGDKDDVPPKFVKASPEPYTINFDEDEVRIYFDEYVKLNNAQQQIIISPPIEPRPNITPLGGPSKSIKIKFNDTVLKPNTTYAINFGRSIEDNNEGNPLEFFKYVFSTGSYIDSLKVSGTINDAFLKEPETFITVALYEVNESFTDSIVYNEIPRYVTNTLDSANTFQFENLKEGNYKLFAFKDNNNNYKYEPKSDKIAFSEDVITLPTDSTFQLNIFKEILPLRFEKPKQISKYHFIFGYEGLGKDAKIELLSETPDDFEFRQLKDANKDTIHYWYKPFIEDADSLVFAVKTESRIDTLVARYKDQFQDSLIVNRDDKVNVLVKKYVSLNLNTPIDSINESLFSIVDKDTLDVPFQIEKNLEKNSIKVAFEALEKSSYNLMILPNGIYDFLGNTNDTLRYTVRTRELSDYGDLTFNVVNAKSYPMIVQLLDERGNLQYELYNTEEQPFRFKSIDAKQYMVRVIYDENSNGIWDTGNYLGGKQPELVIFYPDLIDVRANSEINQSFILK